MRMHRYEVVMRIIDDHRWPLELLKIHVIHGVKLFEIWDMGLFDVIWWQHAWRGSLMIAAFLKVFENDAAMNEVLGVVKSNREGDLLMCSVRWVQRFTMIRIANFTTQSPWRKVLVFTNFWGLGMGCLPSILCFGHHWTRVSGHHTQFLASPRPPLLALVRSMSSTSSTTQHRKFHSTYKTMIKTYDNEEERQ